MLQPSLPTLQAPTRLQSLAIRETPAARIAANPAACLTAELIAPLIGGNYQLEAADAILSRYGGDIRQIYNAPAEEIARLPHISQTAAVRIRAALALALRLQEPTPARTVINSPADAAALVLYDMSLLEQEYLKTILLDTRNQVLDIVEIYHGSVNSSQVRIGEVFRPAIRRLAPAMIVVHNHPSGDPTPSPDDVSVTRAMVQAGKLMDIEILDHLVIGSNRFVSLKERGLGFS